MTPPTRPPGTNRPAIHHVHQSRGCIARRGGQAEGGHRHERRTDRVDDRHSRHPDEAGDDQEATADTEEAGAETDQQADAAEERQKPGRGLDRETNTGVASAAAGLQHQQANDDHENAEQSQELLAVDRLSDRRAGRGSSDPGGREDQGRIAI